MNLRWLVKQDGTRVLQAQEWGFFPEPTITETSAKLSGTTVKLLAWIDVPEFREPEKDPIMAEQENSA